MESPRIITFTGPSGSGKTTILTELFKKIPGLAFVPSYTTRAARSSDFPTEFRHVTNQEFQERQDQEEFIWAVEVHGNRYGTRYADIEEALKADHLSVMTLVPEATSKLFEYTKKGNFVPLFVLPPPPEVLRKRLKERGEEEAVIERRIADCASWEEAAKESHIPYRYVSNEGTVEEIVQQLLSVLSYYIV
ncbi:MAG: AAA family ATPase [Parcubacteria group bacterium]|nr:AAA family ATPase [Parcubacteria group bacterium]